jgi:alpha-mannosidase
MDGQAILVMGTINNFLLINKKDYLDLFPDHQDIIVSLNKNKMLSIGPWYIEPGEFLVSGEALIRNLMIGRQVTFTCR